MAKSLVTPHTEFKDLPQILTVEEVATFLRIHRSTVYEIKKLAKTRINGAIRFKKEAVGRYIGNS